MTPQKTAVYWTEYVVRHNGAPHIKSAATQLSFIEYHMIDVFGLIILIGLGISAVIFWSLSCCYKKLLIRKKISLNKKLK